MFSDIYIYSMELGLEGVRTHSLWGTRQDYIATCTLWVYKQSNDCKFRHARKAHPTIRAPGRFEEMLAKRDVELFKRLDRALYGFAAPSDNFARNHKGLASHFIIMQSRRRTLCSAGRVA